jgi:hypothetical protein
MKELSKDLVMSQLPKKQQLMVSDEDINEINKLAKDPDYGPEFLQTYMDHLIVLKDNLKNSHSQYITAIKFFSLVEGSHTLRDAYIKTFPERWQERSRRSDDPDAVINAEASRFNKTRLVNDVRRMSAIPIQLIHRHILHEAILSQAHLMRTSRSDMVRQKAGATLIAELKPTEDQTININVDDGSKSAIQELREATERLAAAERRSVDAGVPMRDIANSKIIEGEFNTEKEDS